MQKVVHPGFSSFTASNPIGMGERNGHFQPQHYQFSSRSMASEALYVFNLLIKDFVGSMMCWIERMSIIFSLSRLKTRPILWGLHASTLFKDLCQRKNLGRASDNLECSLDYAYLHIERPTGTKILSPKHEGGPLGGVSHPYFYLQSKHWIENKGLMHPIISELITESIQRQRMYCYLY